MTGGYSYTFSIPGKPGYKGRHRTATRGRGGKPLPFPRQHPDPKTVSFEAKVGVYALQAGIQPIKGPVRMSIHAMYQCPKSQERKRKPRPARPKTTKPDLDNIEKAILDGLNGIAYADDAQVCAMESSKWIAAQGEPPRLVVVIRPFSGEPPDLA